MVISNIKLSSNWRILLEEKKKFEERKTVEMEGKGELGKDKNHHIGIQRRAYRETGIGMGTGMGMGIGIGTGIGTGIGIGTGMGTGIGTGTGMGMGLGACSERSERKDDNSSIQSESTQVRT